MFHNIGKQDLSLVSMVSISKGFLTIDSERKEVKMTKFPFDHRKMSRLADGFMLKPMKKFIGKGIKKLTLFRPKLASETQSSEEIKQYIFAATYKHVPPQQQTGFQYGFNQDTKAPQCIYTMEVFQMPRPG